VTECCVVIGIHSTVWVTKGSVAMSQTISFPLHTMDAGHTRQLSTSLGTSALVKMVAVLFMAGYYKQFTTLISVTRTIWKEVLASMTTPQNTSVFRQ